MADSLFFVLAPAPGLPPGLTTWSELVDVQARGLEQVWALRIFACPSDWSGTLETLVEAGLAHSGGADPYGAAAPALSGLEPPAPPLQRNLRCDALVPVLDATSLCLGIYAQATCQAEASPDQAQDLAQGELPGPIQDPNQNPIQCLACLPLAEIENETCWFYPTENGRYLSWQSQRPRSFLPGRLPDGEASGPAESFEPGQLRLLWSLLADDPALTCVGLTYRGRRIEWPIQPRALEAEEAAAVWTWFELDDLSPQPWQRLDRIETSPRC
jgi:hypothetical protein